MRIRDTKNYQDISADDLYEDAVLAFEKAEFNIWKKRPLGWLLMADRKIACGLIQANAACRPGDGGVISITLESEACDEESLQKASQQIFALLEDLLGL